jgi:hypothetical protein
MMGGKIDFFRAPKTHRERKETERARDQGIKPRGKRSKRGLPSDWDDIDRSGYGKHGWKQNKKRRHQYREDVMTREDLIEEILTILLEGPKVNFLSPRAKETTVGARLRGDKRLSNFADVAFSASFAPRTVQGLKAAYKEMRAAQQIPPETERLNKSIPLRHRLKYAARGFKPSVRKKNKAYREKWAEKYTREKFGI